MLDFHASNFCLKAAGKSAGVGSFKGKLGKMSGITGETGIDGTTGKVAFGRVTFGKLTLGKVTLGKVGRVAFGKVGRVTFGKVTFGTIGETGTGGILGKIGAVLFEVVLISGTVTLGKAIGGTVELVFIETGVVDELLFEVTKSKIAFGITESSVLFEVVVVDEFVDEEFVTDEEVGEFVKLGYEAVWQCFLRDKDSVEEKRRASKTANNVFMLFVYK